jgi:hypothetical protein
VFNTAAGRTKARNVERDPRVSVLVVDRADGYRWVAIRGRPEITTEGADAHIDRMARKYTREGWQARAGEVRLLVRIRPERISAYGLSSASVADARDVDVWARRLTRARPRQRRRIAAVPPSVIRSRETVAIRPRRHTER